MSLSFFLVPKGMLLSLSAAAMAFSARLLIVVPYNVSPKLIWEPRSRPVTQALTSLYARPLYFLFLIAFLLPLSVANITDLSSAALPPMAAICSKVASYASMNLARGSLPVTSMKMSSASTLGCTLCWCISQIHVLNRSPTHVMERGQPC